MGDDGDALGLASGTVALKPYNATWPALFERERRALAESLGGGVLAIEHIGSTSVPGLAAKPIIDIAIAVESFDEAVALVAPMVDNGYVYRGENGIPRRHFFCKGSPRTHHVHMFEIASDNWRRHLVFRDALRCDPLLASRYESIKRELARLYHTDVDSYTNGKSDFIAEVERRAIA